MRTPHAPISHVFLGNPRAPLVAFCVAPLKTDTLIAFGSTVRDTTAILFFATLRETPKLAYMTNHTSSPQVGPRASGHRTTTTHPRPPATIILPIITPRKRLYPTSLQTTHYCTVSYVLHSSAVYCSSSIVLANIIDRRPSTTRRRQRLATADGGP